MIPTTIRLNGKVFTRNSVAVRVNGIFRITEVDSIDWFDEKPHELVPAMNDGGAPLGKGEGNYSCGGTISVYADACSKFETAAMALSPQARAAFNLAAATFQLAITMREDVRTRAVLLVNCNIVGRPQRTVGADGAAIVKQYQLQPTYLTEDGLALVNLLPAL